MELCIAITTRGVRCKYKASQGDYCKRHHNNRHGKHIKVNSDMVRISEICYWVDGLITLNVTCPICRHENYHTVTHASSRKDNKINIIVSDLGNRCCDHCRNNYSLTSALNWSCIVYDLVDYNFTAHTITGDGIISESLNKFVNKKKNALILTLPRPFSNSKSVKYMLRVDKFTDSDGFVPVGYINLKFDTRRTAYSHYDDNMGKEGMRRINCHRTGKSDWHPTTRLRCVVCKEEDIDLEQNIYTINPILS